MSLQLIDACKLGRLSEVNKLWDANYSLIERDEADKCKLQKKTPNL